MWRLLDVVGDLLFALDAAGLLAFVGLYGWRSRWRSSSVGRVVFGFMAVVTAIMVSAVVLGLLGDGGTELRLVLRVVLYGALLAGIVHLIRVLLRAQRQDRDPGGGA